MCVCVCAHSRTRMCGVTYAKTSGKQTSSEKRITGTSAWLEWNLRGLSRAGRCVVLIDLLKKKKKISSQLLG